MTELTQAVLGFETDREQIDRIQTVGTTPTRILDQNPNRLQIVFVNPTSNDVFIDTSAEVALGDGFSIPAGNGSIVFNIDQDGDVPTSEWYAVADTAGTDIVTRGEELRGEIPEPGGEVLG
jgi:hypothetical protein